MPDHTLRCERITSRPRRVSFFELQSTLNVARMGSLYYGATGGQHVFLFLSFLVAGGSYIAVDTLAPILLFAVAALLVLSPVLFGITWLSDHTPVYMPIIASWEWLSGWHVGQDIAANPPRDPHATIGVLLLALVASVVMILIGLCIAAVGLTAVVAAPIGVLMSIFGGLVYLLSRGRRPEALGPGLGVAALGLGATILAGVLMRVEDLLSYVGSKEPAPLADAKGPLVIGAIVLCATGWGYARAAR